jgi:hypothetical protein
MSEKSDSQKVKPGDNVGVDQTIQITDGEISFTGPTTVVHVSNDNSIVVTAGEGSLKEWPFPVQEEDYWPIETYIPS